MTAPAPVSGRSTSGPAAPPEQARLVPVRRAVGSAILLVAVLAVALFAVPLALAASHLYRDEAVGRLSAEASRAAGRLSGATLAAGAVPVRLPPPRHAGTLLALYTGNGDRVAGEGPAQSPLARAVAADGDEHEELSGGELAVAVPLHAGRQDVIVRAAMPYEDVLDKTWTTFGAMSLLGVAVLGFAALLAHREAGRIAAPLEALTRAAHALGAGDFRVRPVASRVYEAAAAGHALEVTARRLGSLLDRERSFTSDASHQIRTPLTALRLGLERALITPGADHAAAIGEALDRIDRVESTVDELLARVRDTLAPAEPTDLAAAVEQAAAERWRELARDGGRALRLRAEPGLPAAAASPAVLHQVLDVLVTNALEHGAGTVTVAVRSAVGGLAVDVSDEGPGFDEGSLAAAFHRSDPRARGTGIGLALARDLAQSVGGRLVVAGPGPRPVVTLLLHRWSDPTAYSQRAADRA